MAQDDYYYEIQLTNKQLVFYFMAGATGLILSFLAGVMVGRGVDAVGEVQAAKPVREERIVPEEKPATPPSAEALSYAQRLESEKPDESLDRGKTATAAKESAAKPPDTKPPGSKESAAKEPAAKESGRTAGPKEGETAAPKAKPASEKPAPSPAAETKAAGSKEAPAPAAPAPGAKPAPQPAAPGAAAKPEHPPAGAFTIQVGAFKDKATAESVVTRLKSKGFSAYVASPEGAEGGLYNVRVGSFGARADAERVQAKLRDEEKFKPFIVKQ